MHATTIVLRRSTLIACVGALVLFAFCGVAGAATFTVTSTADAPLAPGATACQSIAPGGTCTLRAAVQAADNAGGSSTIAVPAGTYALTIPAAGPAGTNDPATGDLDITSGASVIVTGAGAGSTIIDPSVARDRAFAVAPGAALTLQRVTVQNGHPSAQSTGRNDGGAIYSQGALTLSQDLFTADRAPAGAGGAIRETGGDALTVRDSTFTSNYAPRGGGAIADDGPGVLTLTRDTFGAASGGGNAGGDHGGAVSDASSTAATIEDSSFIDNRAPDHAPANSGLIDGGGALFLSGHDYVLDHDAFTGNRSGDHGGAILWMGGRLRSRDTSFVANVAGNGGGGALAAQTTDPLTLTNVTMSNNAAASGGGIAFTQSTPVELVNDTLYNDSATAGNELSGAGGLTANGSGVQNTLIGNDPAQPVTGAACAPALPVGVDLGHNLATDGTCLDPTTAPGDRPSTSISLGPPSDNGGTVLTDSESQGQPSVDAGTSSAGVCPTVDARGAPRPQGSACDIGAYELIPPPPQTTTTAVTTTTTVPGPGTTTTVTAPSTTTPPGAPPSARTRGAMGITSSSAFLGGIVDPHGTNTTYGFQVGTTRAYGLTTVLGRTDSGPLTVETRIGGLKPSTLYHYRLVAASAAGSSLGADRSFRTTSAYDGALRLSARTLRVRGGRVYVPLTCASTRPCVLRFSITITARLSRTRTPGTVSFTRSTNRLVTVRAHRSAVISAPVSPAALAILKAAPRHRLIGKLSTRPRTPQLGVIATVTLTSS